MAEVLVVEDDPALRDVICYQLRREGYRVREAEDGVVAVQQLRSHEPDVVVLDLMLPRLAGLDVLRILREESQAWVIIVTARDAEADCITSLELGADDYVTKPFSNRELMARVRAALRRHSDGASSRMSPATAATLRTTIHVDVARHQVWKREELVSLSPREFELLAFLAQHPNQVCTRDQILEAVWGYAYGGEARTVDVHIHWLRQKLEDDPSHPKHFVTVRQYGYRYVPEP